MSDEELLKTCIEMMMYSLEVAVDFLSEAEIYQDTYYLIRPTKADNNYFWQYFVKNQNGENYFASFNPESANTPKDVKALHTRLTQLIHEIINNNIMIAQEGDEINPQLLQSLTKSFWDNRLDDLDLSIYTLEELELI